jgi:hypothetical protein
MELNPVIKMRYDYNLETINIESNDLRGLLNKLFEYKKERLKEFIIFLRSNEKLGKISISWEYTKRWSLWGTPFKKKKESVDVVHSYKETLEYYGDALKNYQLDPAPTEIIKSVLSEIDLLTEWFDKCRSAIEHHRNEDLFVFYEADSIKSHYFDQENKEIELLKKCRAYKKIHEKNVEPLLKDILRVNQKTSEALRMPQSKIGQNLRDEIIFEREHLREKLIMVHSKLKELRIAVDHELEEMS